MQYLLTCLYCNNSWRIKVYSNIKLEGKCSKCHDTNISIKELDKSRIDAYQGCPPFAEKNKQQIVLDIPDYPHWVGTD